MTANNKLAKAYQINKIISYALAASMLLYVVIVEAFRFKGITLNLLPPAVLDKLRFVFVFLSFALYFIINFINQKLLIKKSADTSGKLAAETHPHQYHLPGLLRTAGSFRLCSVPL